MLYRFKASFQKLADRFATSGMTANRATALGIVFILLSMACFYWGTETKTLLWLNPLVIFFRFIMNALDGLLARRQQTASPAGEVMNELSDVIGDTLNYGILYFLFPQHQGALVLVLLSIWFCEFVAVLGKGLPEGIRRQESFGGGKPERAVFLGLLSMAWAVNEVFVSAHLSKYFILVAALIIFTGLRRIQKSLEAARGKTYTSKTLYGR